MPSGKNVVPEDDPIRDLKWAAGQGAELHNRQLEKAYQRGWDDCIKREEQRLAEESAKQ